MGVNTTEVVNQSRLKRDYSFSDHVNGSKLSPQTKSELLISLTGKRRTMLNGAIFMLKHATLKFDDFERALSLLNRANNAYGLCAVEAALQTQIDVVRRMSNVDLSQEDKSLCLYTLQNMIFALSDFHLSNDKENDFMPRILQEQYQMLLKGSTMNMDWDTLYEGSYSTQYQDAKNPVLANWKFLDSDLIKNNMKNMSQSYNMTTTNNRVSDYPKQVYTNINNGVINWGKVELKKTSDVEINRILGEALKKFDANHLQNNLPELFNFVKDSLEPQQIDTPDYQILHEVVLSSMRSIVEIGSNQQRKAMLQQQNDMGRSI